MSYTIDSQNIDLHTPMKSVYGNSTPINDIALTQDLYKNNFNIARDALRRVNGQKIKCMKNIITIVLFSICSGCFAQRLNKYNKEISSYIQEGIVEVTKFSDNTNIEKVYATIQKEKGIFLIRINSQMDINNEIKQIIASPKQILFVSDSLCIPLILWDKLSKVERSQLPYTGYMIKFNKKYKILQHGWLL